MKLYYLFSLIILVGCEKLEWTSQSDTVFRESLDSELDSLGYVMSNDVLERAYQMATIEWTPVNPVPMNGGGYYPKGKTVTGIPYSSVKEISTYLFQDVSYHTFMTAVHNPKSVLYTEDISQPPYHGKNCAPYYGAVCSSAVMCAFGISTPYYVSQIIRLPSMERLDNQAIDSLRICDVIARSGHVQLVFDVEHRADTLYRITCFESSGKSAHLTEYTKKQFQKLWDDGRYVGYRYKYIRYSETETVFRALNPITYNDDLCPSKGDKAVYRTTDTVIVNIFNHNYDKIVLTNCSTGENISVGYSGELHKFYDLNPGIYSIHLQNNKDKSAEVSFEVIETDVSYLDSDTEDYIDVHFHSSANPVYVAFCNMVGDSLCYYPISATEREQGYISVPRMDRSEYYCKVVFKGEYGRIINEPIRVL